MKLNIDEWQKEILETKGNILLCSGRQVGKSTIISMRDGSYVCENPNKSVLIISATERQAEEIFNKCLYFIQDNYPKLIKKGKDKPTKHVLKLNNGSIIRCLPTGLAGTGIRGFTIHRLTADEAAFIGEDVWEAVTPMLLTTGGDIALLSTPHGKKGFFWKSYNNPDFKVFKVNSEEVIRNRPISQTWTEIQREGALRRLEQEKRTMSANQYAQEYMGEFIAEFGSFFPDSLIAKVCTARKTEDKSINSVYYMGMDIARLGDDKTTYEIFKKEGDSLLHVNNIVTEKTRLNETYNKTLELDKMYNFREIFMDDGGIGVGIFDYLLSNSQTASKIVALNNRSRPLDRDEAHNKKLLKEDLYNNLLMLMEQGRIRLLEDDEVISSLRSVQFEYIIEDDQPTRLKIFSSPHSESHIVEGITRGAWAMKNKSLNIWAAWSNHGKIYTSFER